LSIGLAPSTGTLSVEATREHQRQCCREHEDSANSDQRASEVRFHFISRATTTTY
jgi:hypothetical protein